MTKNIKLQVKKFIKASPQAVFEAWTKPELMKQWYAPGEMTTPSASSDLKVGGKYHVEMKGAKDGDCVNPTVKGVYKKIIPNKLISFSWSWEGDTDPESLVTVELKGLKGGTEVILTHEKFSDVDTRDKHQDGWNGCLANLAKFCEASLSLKNKSFKKGGIKMKTKVIVLSLFISMLIFGSTQLRADEQQKPYVGSDSFEQLKQLVGSWEGTMDKGQGPTKITANYKLTAGGSALVETIFEGMPHEMVTIYYDSPDHKLNLTHFCMLHNRPEMVLKSAKNGELVFDLIKSAKLDSAKEDHMHSLTLNFEGKDRLVQRWARFKEGKKSEMTDLSFNRVK